MAIQLSKKEIGSELLEFLNFTSHGNKNDSDRF